MSIKARQSVESVSSSINAMLSILNGVTPLSVEKTNGGVSLTLSLNPFEYVMSLLQKVAGYDRVVEFLTEIVAYGLPMLEDSLKIALVESLKDLFSCSVNPVINEELIKYGVILDLSTIDLMGVLKRCPLGTENELFKTNGSFFYFDAERFTIPDELERCKDLNAVIWYVKHRATDRTVWYGYEHQDEEHELLSVQNGTNPGTLPSEKDGVITMEFSEKSSQLTDCEGNRMSIQVPHGNCLHVFLGNTKGVSDETQPSYDGILNKTEDFSAFYNEVNSLLTELYSIMNQEQDISRQASIQCEINVLKNLKNTINDSTPISEIFPNLPIDSSNGKRYITVGDNTIYLSEYTYTHTKQDLGDENKIFRTEIARIASNYQYRAPQENYYYGKTLFEFNTDYIQSVKFFDSTVLACQIVDIMTGCFGVSLNLSFEERLIRNEVEQMLQKIVENSETITVSDCFFTFTNDEYNLMIDETEKERIGKYTGSLYGYGSTIDYNKIYEELDEISSCATLSEQVTVIKRSFNEISRTIKPEEYKETDEFSLNFTFLNNLLKSLTLSVVYNIISPKIYMLMAINLKILGREPNFDVAGFIAYFKTLLINVIKNITDNIMSQMSEWLVSLVKELVQRLADRLLLEQAQYYMQLLMSCMRAFRLMWGEEDWNMADVEYADIVSTNTTNSARIRNTSC
jgi:hypothetical protein